MSLFINNSPSLNYSKQLWLHSAAIKLFLSPLSFSVINYFALYCVHLFAVQYIEALCPVPVSVVCIYSLLHRHFFLVVAEKGLCTFLQVAVTVIFALLAPQ